MEQNQIVLPKFKLSKFLKLHYTYNTLLNSIVNELKVIPDIQGLKLNKSLTALVCSILENVKFKKTKGQKIDKKTLAVEILTKLFDLEEKEIELVSDDIDFICENNLHITPKTCYSYIKSFFF